MFGGHGLRIDGLFVALMAFDRLYLKVDDISQPHLEAAVCEPFTYTGKGKGKPITMSYWTVPPQAMEAPIGMQRQAQPQLEPRRWLFLNFTHRRIRAALAGQGVALARLTRLALIGESLAQGDLVEPFGRAGRIDSPFGYWLVRWPARRDRPELRAFEDWVLAQAAQTRLRLDEAPDAPRLQGASAKMPHARTATR
jgi:hypothetical protein